MSLSTKILIGLVAGIGCGLFAGEYTSRLNIVGDVFIGLLQMTVLPYIVVSLIANIGRLSHEQAQRLLWVGGILLLISLAIGTVALFVIPLSFPKLVSASFFQRSMIERRQPIDVLDLYVPTNPFNSLSAGTVPAIVVFCIAIGIGLISVKGKDGLIRALDVLTEALIRINKIAVRFTPAGVFAIAAAAAGSMTFEDFGRLQAYLLSYTVAVGLLTFFILPAMAAATTPFRFTDLFRAFGDTLLLIFVTGKMIVVMPQMIESVKKLYRIGGVKEQGELHDADLLMPLIYPFPNLGTFIIFIFIPFTAWFAGRPLELRDYPLFLGATLMVSFVSPLVGIPFLLDMMRLPSDVFPLFVASSIYTDRVRVALGGMHLFVFTVVAVAALQGMLRVRWRAAVLSAVAALALVVVCVFGVRMTLARTLRGTYTKDKVLSRMQLLDSPVESSTLPEAGPNPVPVVEGESLLSRIHRRGVLRFGYDAGAERVPFCFVNANGDAVGYDIEMMHLLARTLGVRLELVPTTRETMRKQADEDHFDLAGCGFSLTSARSAAFHLSAPYLDLHAAFVVRDYRRHDLDSLAKLAERPAITIGAATDQEFVAAIASSIPQATIVRVDRIEDFFEGRRPEIHSLFTNAETGSAMTLLHPEYSVVIPADMKIALPTVFVLSRNDDVTKQFLNDWILLRQKNGVLDRLYDHWILGKTAEPRKPRWSVIRNVLGWVR